MKIKNLKEQLKNIPDDYEINLSKFFIIDTEEEYTAILDIPLCPIIAVDKEQKHVRFLVYADEDFNLLKEIGKLELWEIKE